MNNKTPAPKIDDFQQVTSVSSGSVERTTWNANAGWDRKKQIEAEREKEMEAYLERQAAADPLQMRLLAMEMAIKDLQTKVKGLEKVNE